MTSARVRVGTVVTGAVLVLTGSCGFTAQTGQITTTSTGSVAILVGPSVQSPALLTSGPYLVTKVVDGDTLWVQRDGQQVKLRLIGSILQRPMIPGTGSVLRRSRSRPCGVDARRPPGAPRDRRFSGVRLDKYGLDYSPP